MPPIGLNRRAGGQVDVDCKGDDGCVKPFRIPGGLSRYRTTAFKRPAIRPLLADCGTQNDTRWAIKAGTSAIDPFPHFLAGLEYRNVLGRDLDCFPGLGIAGLSGKPLVD